MKRGLDEDGDGDGDEDNEEGEGEGGEEEERKDEGDEVDLVYCGSERTDTYSPSSLRPIKSDWGRSI